MRPDAALGNRRRRDLHRRRARLGRRGADREGADARAPGGVGARGCCGGRAPTRSTASRTARRSRRTRSSSGAARGRHSSATAGFEHLLHLRRQTRAHLYRPCAEHPEPLVPLERSVGVRGRIGRDGELEPLDLETLPELDAEAIAVCLLFAFRDSAAREGGRGGASTPLSRRPRRRLPRGRARVPRVRAGVDDGGGRVSRARAGADTSRALSEACASAGLIAAARHALLRRPGDARGSRASTRPSRCSRARRRGSSGLRESRRSPGSRTRSRSTWAGRPRTSARSRTARRAASTSETVGGFPVRLPTLAVHTVGAGGGSIVVAGLGRRAPSRPRERGRRPRTRLLRARRRAGRR